MLHSHLKQIIILQMWEIASILLISANLANAQDEGQYLELPSIPRDFKRPLPNGFHPGGSITINGTIDPGAVRFSINLEDNSGSNVYLHFNPRYNEKRILLNHKLNRDWMVGQGEFTSLAALSQAADFQINILCNKTGYMIDINTTMSYFFNHRFDTSIIRNIRFAGDVSINSVHYIPGNATCVLEGCQPNEQCVYEDGDYYCQCEEGYSGPRCQESCKANGCTGNNVCIIDNGKYACRSRKDLQGYSANNSVNCYGSYVPVDTECIWVVLTKLNWDAARFKCEENDGYLLEPDFPINFRQYMSNHYPEDGTMGFWLGGADRGLDRWVWVNSRMDIPEGKSGFPWGEGEPNDLGYGVREDCMNLYSYLGKAYKYNDGKCNGNWYFICEAPPMIIQTDEAALVEASVLSLGLGSHQMQVAILLLLIISIIIVMGYLIYKNLTIIKKAYGSFADRSVFFLNQKDNTRLNEEEYI